MSRELNMNEESRASMIPHMILYIKYIILWIGNINWNRRWCDIGSIWYGMVWYGKIVVGYFCRLLNYHAGSHLCLHMSSMSSHVLHVFTCHLCRHIPLGPFIRHESNPVSGQVVSKWNQPLHRIGFSFSFRVWKECCSERKGARNLRWCEWFRFCLVSKASLGEYPPV